MSAIRCMGYASLLALIPCQAAFAAILDPVDAASGIDWGPKDGVYDAFVNPGNLSLVDNGFTEIRFAAEFDLTGLPPVLSAKLQFYRAFESAVVDIYGYAGDGTVSLADIGTTSLLLVDDLLVSGPGQLGGCDDICVSVDVTSFVQSGAEGFVGFSWDEESARTLTNIYPGVRLSVELAPEPSTWGLFSMGVLALAVSRRRSRRSATGSA